MYGREYGGNDMPTGPIDVICYPYIFYDQPVIEPTDKVTFPSYVTNQLFQRTRPGETIILVSLTNKITRKKVICSIHENSSDDCAYCPQWIMDYLFLQPGDSVCVDIERIPKVKSVKFKPLHPAFYSLDDPLGTIGSILNNNYRTLTRGITISFKTNVCVDGMNMATDILLQVTEVQPFTSVCIVDSTFDIDFEENPDILPQQEKKKKHTPQRKQGQISTSSKSAIPMMTSSGNLIASGDMLSSGSMMIDSSKDLGLMDEDDDDNEGSTSLTFDFPPKKEDLLTSSELSRYDEPIRLGRSTELKDKPLDPDCQLCEFCNTPVNKKNYRMHTLRCQRMYKLCAFCGKKLLIGSKDAAEHEKTHETVPCSQCGKEVERQHLKEHYNNLCPKRLLTCKYCGLMKEANTLFDHERACGQSFDHCKKCDRRIKRMDMKKHEEEDCPFSEKMMRMEEERMQQLLAGGASNQPIYGGNTIPQSQEQYECPMCMMPFNNTVDLDTHILSFHPELYD